MRTWVRVIGLGLVAGVLAFDVFLTAPVDAVVTGKNVLVSYNSTNTALSSSGGNTVLHTSADGNIVVWPTSSNDVVTGNTLTGTLLYSRNMKTGETSIVSLSNSGVPINALADEFAVSSTGRYVVFSSSALNAVDSPVLTLTNRKHLYIRDTQANTTRMVDATSDGTPSNLLSASTSYAKSVSDDGRFVGFTASATNLGGTSATLSPYVKDMLTGEVVRLAVSSSGELSNASVYGLKASCDGSVFVYYSAATNITPDDDGQLNTYIVDMRNGVTTSNLTYSINGDAYVSSISCNGRYLVLSSNATNLTDDVVDGSTSHFYRYDRLEGDYSLVDKSSTGYVPTGVYPGGPMYGGARIVSDDGKVVFFGRDPSLVSPVAPSNLELYVRNPEENKTELVPVDASGVAKGLGSGTTQVLHGLEISATGDSVVYISISSGLVPGIGSSLGKKVVMSELE